jgi:hypothetical protein
VSLKGETIMTTKEFAEQMREIQYRYEADDEELCHIMMDNLMCEVLESLGYGEGVLIFIETDKWYA